MLPQMIAVIAGENNNRPFREAGFVQGIQHFPDLSVHVSHGRIVATQGLLLATEVHLHVLACLVVDSRFRDIVPVARHLLGELQFFIGQEGVIVGPRRDKGNMRPNKTHPQEERFVPMVTNQVAGFGGGLSIGMHEVITIGLNHHEGIPANHRLPSIRISLQGLSGARRLPLRTRTIESLRP